MNDFEDIDELDGVNPPKTRKFLRDRSSSELMGAHYAHMFREDIQSRFWPYSFGDEKGIKAELEGDEDSVRRAEILLSSISSSRRGRDEIVNSLRSIAELLVWNGACHFEICSNLASDAYALSYIPCRGFYDLVLGYAQALGPNSSFEKGRHIVLLRRRDVWTINMPRSLGGASGFRRTIKALSSRNSLAPDFWYSDMESASGTNPSRFDFKLFQRYQRVLRGRAKKRWGWTERNYDTEGMTEYYFFYLELMLEHATAVMREHVIASLNGLFKRLNIKARLVITGPHSPGGVQDVILRLARGELHFDDVLAFNRYKSEFTGAPGS